MSEFSPVSVALDFCSRATPYRLLKRVAGIAFNFSSVSMDAASEKKNDEQVAHRSFRPAFEAM